MGALLGLLFFGALFFMILGTIFRAFFRVFGWVLGLVLVLLLFKFIAFGAALFLGIILLVCGGVLSFFNQA